MRDILCVGEMVIDFLPGNEPGSYLRKAGGAPANVAIAAARQGLKAGFCGKVGNDDFGRFLMDTLAANEVDVCAPPYTDEAITTMAFVSLDESGNRSFTFARKPGADMFLTKKDVDLAGIEDSRIVHAGSCSLSRLPASEATEYAMEKAATHGKLVSFDVNYRNLMWNDDMKAASKAVSKVLPFVDLLKISDEEAEMIGGEEAVGTVMAQNGIALVVETMGSEGARWYWKDRSGFTPSIRSECVDSCGAGDAFWGSFLTSLIQDGVRCENDLNQGIIEKAMMRGSIAGALCVRVKGAIESLPSSADIERFLKNE